MWIKTQHQENHLDMILDICSVSFLHYLYSANIKKVVLVND